ncbi:MAG: hypothetical protein ABIQ52_10535 [Vicinamibacterales bacterium]
MENGVQRLGFSSALVVILGLLLGSRSAGRQRHAFGDTSLYQAVLDRAFYYADDLKTRHTLYVLRYTHTDRGEFQVLFDLEGSQYRVTRWRLPQDAASVWQQLEQVSNPEAGLTAETALSRISVERAEGTVAATSADGLLLRRGTKLTTQLRGAEQFGLDGAEYHFSVRSLERDLQLRVQGPQNPHNSADPMIRWMGEVRAAFANHQMKSSPKESSLSRRPVLNRQHAVYGPAAAPLRGTAQQ